MGPTSCLPNLSDSARKLLYERISGKDEITVRLLSRAHRILARYEKEDPYHNWTSLTIEYHPPASSDVLAYLILREYMTEWIITWSSITLRVYPGTVVSKDIVGKPLHVFIFKNPQIQAGQLPNEIGVAIKLALNWNYLGGLVSRL